MKYDLATSIIAAIVGVIAAYFIVGFLIPPLGDVSFKTLESSSNSTLEQPNEEVFNFRAVNPTVEVYVGQCTEYNEKGECVDDRPQTSTEENEQPSEGSENGPSD